MASDDEKEPPVPADLVGAPERIHRDQAAKESDRAEHGPSEEEPDAGD